MRCAWETWGPVWNNAFRMWRSTGNWRRSLLMTARLDCENNSSTWKTRQALRASWNSFKITDDCWLWIWPKWPRGSLPVTYSKRRRTKSFPVRFLTKCSNRFTSNENATHYRNRSQLKLPGQTGCFKTCRDIKPFHCRTSISGPSISEA